MRFEIPCCLYGWYSRTRQTFLTNLKYLYLPAFRQLIPMLSVDLAFCIGNSDFLQSLLHFHFKHCRALLFKMMQLLIQAWLQLDSNKNLLTKNLQTRTQRGFSGRYIVSINITDEIISVQSTNKTRK